jgi:RHS repeat-associated protein
VKGAVDADRARTGYIGRETDAEHNLGAFGARLYSSEYGRFLAVDKLWEKYRSLQPYQYAGNSPVMAVDRNGKWIQAVTHAAQTAVRNSVPSCYRDAVTFNENGFLNAGPLVEAATGQDSEANIAILASLAVHADGVEVSVDERVNFTNAEGNLGSISFDVVEKQTGGTRAWLGQTLPVESDKGKIGTDDIKFYSTGENIQVVVRKDPPNTSSTVGSTTAHELMGHARFIILCREGKAQSAIHGDSTVEKAITRAEREAKE